MGWKKAVYDIKINGEECVLCEVPSKTEEEFII
jgi:hypothetical protein